MTDPLKQEGAVSVPPGTYWAFSSCLRPAEAIFEAMCRIAAGKDMSRCGFLEIAVAAGEEKVLKVDDAEVAAALEVMRRNVN